MSSQFVISRTHMVYLVGSAFDFEFWKFQLIIYMYRYAKNMLSFFMHHCIKS